MHELRGAWLLCQEVVSLICLEYVAAAIDGLVSDSHGRNVADRPAPVPHQDARRVEQVGVDVGYLCDRGIRVRRGMVEQPLRDILLGEPDDHDEHVGLVARLASPAERVVGEVDVHAEVGDGLPDVGDLLPLADGVGGDERAADRMIAHVLRRLHVPARNVIDGSAVPRPAEHVVKLRALLRALHLRAQKRRVPDDVAAPLRRQDIVPVHAQGVSAHAVRDALQRQEVELPIRQKLLGALHHLLLGNPQRGLADRYREVVYLDGVELADADHDGIVQDARLVALQILDDAQLQLAQADVGLGKEVVAAGRRVEKRQPGELLLEDAELGLPGLFHLLALDGGELGLQVVQEQRVDDLVYVLHAGVVHAPRPAGIRVQRALESGAEDGGADVLPVEPGRCLGQQVLPDLLRELRDDDALVGEQPAVDVREVEQLGVLVGVAQVVGRVQDAEKILERLAHLGRGRILHVTEERLVLLKQARILGEQEEHQPDQQDVQRALLVLVGVDVYILRGE